MELFDLKATHNPHRWYLTLTPDVCVGQPADQKFLFGGIGMGAAIAAMERTCGRPVIWAAAQYLSFAPVGSVVDFDVWAPAKGRQSTQARVTAHIHDKEILNVAGALGSRPGAFKRQWLTAPRAPPPLECPRVDHWDPEESTIQSRLEMRLVKGGFRNLAPAEADAGQRIPGGDHRRSGALGHLQRHGRGGLRQQPRQHPALHAPAERRLDSVRSAD
jgi:hypothetical protein